VRVPLSWLREYVDVDVPAADLARRLSVSSLEVERVVETGVPDTNGNLGLFQVGKVVEAGKHPNADRLQLCRVDVGESEPRQIVCGAWNFGAGATVAVALPGAVLPGADEPLGEAKLRGELSRGMILSERELQLGDDHSGIMVLEEGVEPGTPLADVLPISDAALDVISTLNRGDLLSVYGVAREVAALYGTELRPMPSQDGYVVGALARSTTAASTCAALNAPNLFGTESQRRSVGGRGVAMPAAAGVARKTATLPRNCSGSSATAVSPHRPAKTVWTLARSALPLTLAEGVSGIQSVRPSGAPAAMRRDAVLS